MIQNSVSARLFLTERQKRGGRLFALGSIVCAVDVIEELPEAVFALFVRGLGLFYSFQVLVDLSFLRVLVSSHNLFVLSIELRNLLLRLLTLTLKSSNSLNHTILVTGGVKSLTHAESD